MKTQHTKEPWQINFSLKLHRILADKEWRVIADCKQSHTNSVLNDDEIKSNAALIAACINAMAGIKNPEEFIKMAKAALDIK